MSIESKDSVYGVNDSSEDDLDENKNNNISHERPFTNRQRQRAERYAARHNETLEIPRNDRMIRELKKLILHITLQLTMEQWVQTYLLHVWKQLMILVFKPRPLVDILNHHHTKKC